MRPSQGFFGFFRFFRDLRFALVTLLAYSYALGQVPEVSLRPDKTGAILLGNTELGDE